MNSPNTPISDSQLALYRRARALLRSVTRDNSHLSYEQIEALAEGKVALTGPLLTHISECGSCHTELREMKTFVSAFRAPIQQKPGTSLLDSIRQWFERPLQLSAGLAAIVAICVGLAVVQKNGVSGSTGGGATAAHAIVIDSGQHAPDFEDCNARELASRSAEWHALYQRGEFEQLVQTLRPAAQAGNTVAQTTLGVLLAKGLGTDTDPNMAKLWLRRAAARGDACASQALVALDQ